MTYCRDRLIVWVERNESKRNRGVMRLWKAVLVLLALGVASGGLAEASRAGIAETDTKTDRANGKWRTCPSDTHIHTRFLVRNAACGTARKVKRKARAKFCRRHNGCKTAKPDPSRIFRGKTRYKRWSCRVLVWWEGYRVTCKRGRARIYYLAEV